VLSRFLEDVRFSLFPVFFWPIGFFPEVPLEDLSSGPLLAAGSAVAFPSLGWDSWDILGCFPQVVVPFSPGVSGAGHSEIASSVLRLLACLGPRRSSARALIVRDRQLDPMVWSPLFFFSTIRLAICSALTGPGEESERLECGVRGSPLISLRAPSKILSLDGRRDSLSFPVLWGSLSAAPVWLLKPRP